MSHYFPVVATQMIRFYNTLNERDRRQVLKLTKLSRSTIHLYTKKGFFPSSKKLGSKSVGIKKMFFSGWMGREIGNTEFCVSLTSNSLSSYGY